MVLLDDQNNNAMDADREIAESMTESERNEVLTMRNTYNLYLKMVDSICPAVYGHTGKPLSFLFYSIFPI